MGEYYELSGRELEGRLKTEARGKDHRLEDVDNDMKKNRVNYR